MKYRSLVIWVFLLAVPLWAGSDNGTAGFQFLKTQMGARPAAQAGAFVSNPGDIHAMHYNPAGIASIKERGASFTYLRHVLDFNAGYVAYVQPKVGPGNLGLAVAYMDYGSFEKREQYGEYLGEFAANTIALSGVYAMQPLPQLFAGVGVKYIRSSIDSYASDALAADGGLMYTFAAQNLTIGASFANLGQVMSAFISQKDELPFVYRFGLSKGLAHLPLVLSLNLYKYSDEDWHGALGGEFKLSETTFLRLGYDQAGRDLKVDASGDRLAGLSLGLGMIWRTIHIDYAFSSLGEIGSLNRFTLTGSF